MLNNLGLQYVVPLLSKMYFILFFYKLLSRCENSKPSQTDLCTDSLAYHQLATKRGKRRLRWSSRNLWIMPSISCSSSQKAKMKALRTIMKNFNQNKISIYSLFTLSSLISNDSLPWKIILQSSSGEKGVQPNKLQS